MTDFTIVGGGSGGSALAGRLTEELDTMVLLIEAGPRDWYPKYPLTGAYQLAPQANQNGITSELTQARVLGGGSSINTLVYIRGTAADYDGWASVGCPGWSYRGVLPYFRRAEGNERFAGSYHGTKSPLRVSPQRHTHTLSKEFVQACQEFGMPYNPGSNGARQAGAGPYRVINHNGRHCSAAVANRGHARRTLNLEVCTGAVVRRVIIERDRAVGIELSAGSRSEVVRAEHEVVLATGAERERARDRQVRLRPIRRFKSIHALYGERDARINSDGALGMPELPESWRRRPAACPRAIGPWPEAAAPPDPGTTPFGSPEGRVASYAAASSGGRQVWVRPMRDGKE